MAKAATLEYTGQSSAELIALGPMHDPGSILSALEWAIQAKRDKKLGRISTEEAVVLSILALDREVNNGGFDQFFRNSSRQYAELVVRYLETIGAKRTAQLAAQALAVRGNEKALDRLDQRYYRGHETVVQSKLWKFVTQNQAAIGVPAIKTARARVPKLTAAEKLEQERDRVGELMRRGKDRAALALANRLVREHPRDRECWEELSGVWEAKGNTRRCLEAAEAAIACSPNDAWAYYSACIRALRLQSWTACLDLAARGKRLKISRSIRGMMMDHFGLFGARALHALGRSEEALKWLANVPMIDFHHGSREDPLQDPRQLRKACQSAVRKPPRSAR